MKQSHLLVFSLCGSCLLAACGGSGSTSGDTATHLSVAAPATATVGTAFQVTVTALDAANHTVAGYSGTVHFSSTDGQATLTANSPLMNGMGTFSATLRSSGTQTITATDTVTASITGTSSSIAVAGGPATQFSISAPSTAKGGTAFKFTVTARDAANNVATSYSGTVHFSSSDAQALLPANSILTTGMGTFSATLRTAGDETITATDTVTASITGTSNAILVALACSAVGTQCRPEAPCCPGSMCVAEGDRGYCVADAGGASTAPRALSRFASISGAAVVRQRGVATLPDIAVSLAAADKPAAASYRHHHYKFVDLGTFGGPASYINAEPTQLNIINNAGTIVGGADTSISTPVVSCYNPVLNPDCYVFHAFTWGGGGLKELGTLRHGTFSFAEGINNIGQIAGVSENGRIDPVSGNPIFHAVLWQDVEIQDLGTLGGNSSFAGSINDLGEIAGVALNDIPDPYSIFGLIGGTATTQTRAFLWHGGEMHDLGTLGGPDAFAEFMNGRGDVAGVSYTSNTADPSTGLPHLDPFLWQDGSMKDLGNFGGTNANPNPNSVIQFFSPFVSGLNNRGQVVGSMALPGDQVVHAFLWDGENLSDLNALGGGLGGSFSFAEGLNGAGEVVGTATIPGDQLNHAVLWAHGTTTDLGTLAGDVCSGAQNINSIGQIVGSSQDAMCNPFTHAFLWENGGPMMDLSKLVTADLPLHLKVAYLITDRGEIIGSGSPLGCSVDDDLCDPHVFVLIPCDENHPDIESCDYTLVDVKATAEVPPAAAASKSKVTMAEMMAPIRALRARNNRWLGTRQPVAPAGSMLMPASMTTGQPPGLQVAVQSSTNLAATAASLTPDAVSIFCQVTPASSRAFYFCPGPQTVALKNAGSSTLYVFGVSIGGPRPADFAQEDDCPASLRPGQSCAITVRYAGPISITVINLHKEVTYSGSLLVRVNTLASGETAITKQVPLRTVLPPAE